MAQNILLEEFHLTVLAPRGLSTTEYDVMVQAVTSAQIMARLRHAVRRVFRREASLTKATVRLSR